MSADVKCTSRGSHERIRARFNLTVKSGFKNKHILERNILITKITSFAGDQDLSLISIINIWNEFSGFHEFFMDQSISYFENEKLG